MELLSYFVKVVVICDTFLGSIVVDLLNCIVAFWSAQCHKKSSTSSSSSFDSSTFVSAKAENWYHNMVVHKKLNYRIAFYQSLTLYAGIDWAQELGIIYKATAAMVNTNGSWILCKC